MPKRSLNPNSLKNLRPGQSPGRNVMYDAPKKTHGVTLTDEGWTGLKRVADGLGYSTSELLEQIGRGHVAVLPADSIAAFESAIERIPQPAQPSNPLG